MMSATPIRRVAAGLPRCTRISSPHALRRRVPSVRTSGLRVFPQLRSASTTAEAEVKAAAGDAKASGKSITRRIRNLLYGTAFALVLTGGYLYITDTRAGFHQYIVPPAIRTFFPDAEDAHHIGSAAMRMLYDFGLHPRERADDDLKGDLAVEVFGHTLANPIGISAGLDKNAELTEPLFALGPGLVEVGGITPLPQEGNPKPRVWRVVSQQALINRYGLNSEGAQSVASRLRQRVREFAYHMGFGLDEFGERLVLDGDAGVPPGSLRNGRLLAVQIAKNKVTPEGDIDAVIKDYVTCVQQLGKFADILVVNVSSPNTPGLRSLQSVQPLTHLLTAIVGAAKQVDRKTKPAVMVKVSPDEDTDEQVSGICQAVWNSGVDGVIVGNTTKKRPEPLPKGYILPSHEEQILLEQGGYSGPQMFERTRDLVARYRKLLDQGPREVKQSGSQGQSASNGAANELVATQPDSAELVPTSVDSLEETAPKVEAVPAGEASGVKPFDHPRKVIFATGGITNGKQALEVLNAGASVAMIYTTMVYGGSGTVTRIKQEMRDEIQKK